MATPMALLLDYEHAVTEVRRKGFNAPRANLNSFLRFVDSLAPDLTGHCALGMTETDWDRAGGLVWMLDSAR